MDIFKYDSFQKLSLEFGIKPDTLAGIIEFTNKYYRTFKIPKRNGQLRIITSPYPALKYIQRYILREILVNEIPSNCATGFVKNRSIKENVNPHIGSKCILKMDLKDFFPSITIDRVISVFVNIGFENKVAYMLARICCLDNKLPQGAPTSPSISNIIAKRLDLRINAMCKKYNLKYTRYADDICISGRYIPYKIISYIENIIKNERFQVNSDKTKLIIGNGKKVITGISISSGKTTLPREKKRFLRREAYCLLQIGIDKYLNEERQYDPIVIERLIGKFNFWNYIEPENQYVIKTIEKLKGYSKYIDSRYS